jgi:signal transduction histidine kinase
MFTKKSRSLELIIPLLVMLLPLTSLAQNPFEKTISCSKALSDDPELSRIKGKVALAGATEQTFEMKTNKAYPTPLERKAITLWVSKVHKCSELAENAINEGQIEPALVPLFKGLYPKFEARVLQLYDKKISYGEFARARDEDYSAFLKEVDDIKQALVQQEEQKLREQTQREQTQREQDQRQYQKAQIQAQQEQAQYEERQRAARCRESSQNAASVCNSNSRRRGAYEWGTTPTGDVSCAYWQGKSMQDCR